MSQSKSELWERFKKYYSNYPSIDLSLDVSRMKFSEDFLKKMEPKIQHAFKSMAELESGAIANPDENRMVGHYWLRNPSLAPNEEIKKAITSTLSKIKGFVRDVHEGVIKGEDGIFENLLVIGIGGSALGPQFVSRALGNPRSDKMKIFFFDNTDPDGMDVVLQELTGKLTKTLCVIISKSGGTKETRNGMLEAKNAFVRAGLDFAKHSVAVTGDGSGLDKVAADENWIERFPMWDWVGGRTSELSAVGLLPAALQGIDIEELLSGASGADALTRIPDVTGNPAAQLALMWFHSGNGKGEKDMVILPYKDRLELFSKYLQQLIMESLGKERDLNGEIVHQGIAVYGNKGSTDQHAYVQQLRDGVNNFFATFIEVLTDRQAESIEVEKGRTSGDFLFGFYLGTRQALYENSRESITITIKEVNPRAVGGLIALFERTVGLYASLVNVNAYHQPGVEAGKKAAGALLELQHSVVTFLESKRGENVAIDEICKGLGVDEHESVFKICEHLSMNRQKGIVRMSGTEPGQALYRTTAC